MGALDLLLVVLAFRLLDTGSAGVGFLNAAFGVGSVLGAGGAVLLIGRRRLAPPLLWGAVLWGAALGLTGLASDLAAAAVLLAAAGAGRPLIDVAGRTLLQRVVDERVRARVFGVLEGLAMAALAVGFAVVPALTAVLGDRGAFLVVGAALPTAMLLAWPRLTAVDAGAVVPEAELALLRGVPIFAPLSAPVLEGLAARLVRVDAPTGTTVIREGDTGDRFYVLADGRVEVSVAGRAVDAHGPGGFFGEVALLRDVPRTATVTATTDVRLFALERADFLEAVTGHAASADAAAAVVRTRFDNRRAGEGADDAGAPRRG